MTTIRFEGVSKLYRQHHANSPDGDLWALRNVSFACEEGEVLGLIGRNGCGKSTLLKLAANVTFPTSGTVTCAQPVAPMLELGAGFHHDLSGRDNIKLNGCLLGLGLHIKSDLIDEIVAFAELEQHIDTPVKHYSSGMYARLGFAVAVHSPARLLLVDEVLGVGDHLFRQKCMARMKYLRDRGTTIILVSHDSWGIRSFCSRALLIDDGRVIFDGGPEEALQAYTWRSRGLALEEPSGAVISSIGVFDSSGTECELFEGTALSVKVAFVTGGVPASCVLTARVRREDGIHCATCTSAVLDAHGEGCAVVQIDDLHLVVGRYEIEVSIEDAQSFAPLAVRASKAFHVPGPFDPSRAYDGVIRARHRWSFD